MLVGVACCSLVVCCVLIVACCLMCVGCCSLPDVRCLLLFVGWWGWGRGEVCVCWLRVMGCLLLNVCNALVAVRCWFCVCCLMCAAGRCLLSVVCRSLVWVAGCVLFVVRG